MSLNDLWRKSECTAFKLRSIFISFFNHENDKKNLLLDRQLLSSFSWVLTGRSYIHYNFQKTKEVEL
jgi:hypothetical protein